MYTDKYSSLRSYFHIKYNSHSNLDSIVTDHFLMALMWVTIIWSFVNIHWFMHDVKDVMRLTIAWQRYARETVRWWANTIGADPTSWRFHKLLFITLWLSMLFSIHNITIRCTWCINMKMHTGKYSFVRPYLHIQCISMLNWIVSLQHISDGVDIRSRSLVSGLM